MWIKFYFGNIDYIFLILILFLAAHSFLKGFIHEAISIIVLICSAFIGYKLSNYTSDILSQYIISTFVPIFSFILNFFITYFLLSLLSQSITRKLQITIGLTDRLLGLIFGLLKAYFIILFFYIVVNLIIPIGSQPNFLTHSFFRELIMPLEKQLFYNLNNVNMKF